MWELVLYLLVASTLAEHTKKNEPDCPPNICDKCPSGDVIKALCDRCGCTWDDIVMTHAQKVKLRGDSDVIEDRAASSVVRKWPRGGDGELVVPFHMTAPIAESPLHARAVARSLNLMAARTCFRFREKSPSDNLFIDIIKGGGCYSSVGAVTGGQRLSLGDGCQYVATSAHEFLHAVGFFHEQSRPDRDDFVTVLFQNINPDRAFNFNKLPANAVDSFNSSYDIPSVMQYSGYAFSKNGQPTIIDKATGEALVSQRVAPSSEDWFQTNALYSCSEPGIPLTTGCYHEQDYGHGYRGNRSVTESGLPCQRWDATSPHDNTFTPDLITGAGLEENYCRNPDIFDRPWCYVDSNLKVWEFCNITKCNDSLPPAITVPPAPASVSGFWSRWSPWTPCSVSCGVGYRVRERVCFGNDSSNPCPGDWLKKQTCTIFNCQVGSWKRWGPWSSCNVPCGDGHRYRVRSCRNLNCEDPNVLQNATCSKRQKACPLYEGDGCLEPGEVNSYNGKINVTSKNVPCEYWSNTKYASSPDVEANYCRNPNGRLKKFPWCFEVGTNKRKKCNVPPCNTAAKWKSFGSWSSCTFTCGSGKQYRTRKCKKGVVTQNNCTGSVIQSRNCNEQSCDPNLVQPTSPQEVNIPPPSVGIGCVDNPIDYRGQAQTTLSGKKCQHWDADNPQKHRFDTISEFESLALSENYCRARNSNDLYPGCVPLSTTESWEYCDIPQCTADAVTPPLDCMPANGQYMGNISTTAGGYECQRWDVNTPHNHRFKGWKSEYSSFGLDGNNYCRNPVNDVRGSWCYTTNPHIRYQYCNIPSC